MNGWMDFVAYLTWREISIIVCECVCVLEGVDREVLMSR